MALGSESNTEVSRTYVRSSVFFFLLVVFDVVKEVR